MLVLVWFVLLSLVVVKGAATEESKDRVSVIFGGDVEFSRLIRYLHHKRNCSYVESLQRWNTTFRSVDFSMINLETTLGRPNSKVNEHTLTGLWSDASALHALTKNGVKYVTLANNHIQDFGDKQTKNTIKFLRRYGIQYSGIVYGNGGHTKQKPLIMKKNGLKIGILSYCDLKRCSELWRGMNVGPAILKVKSVVKETRYLRSKEKCDIVILYLHWGVEYGSVINTGVVGIIKNLTKSTNIDLIVGSHPHVTQNHWYTGKTLVAPSLGNFFFMPHNLANHNFNDDTPSEKASERNGTREHFENVWYKQMKVMQDGTNLGRLLKVVFDKNGIVRDQSQYIGIQVFATNDHCLATKIEDNSKWLPICGAEDQECTGTSSCNYVECEKDEPLPPYLGSSPEKGQKGQQSTTTNKQTTNSNRKN